MRPVATRRLFWLVLAAGLMLLDGPQQPPQHATVQARLAEDSRGPNTCSATWQTPLLILWDYLQPKCEATRCVLDPRELIEAIHVGWRNYGATPAEKAVELLIWDDDHGSPGTLLWVFETTTTLLEPGETRVVRYEVSPDVTSGPLWFGHREPNRGPPTSLVDSAAGLMHASAPPPCEDWTPQVMGDYVQAIEFDSGAIAVETRPHRPLFCRDA